MAMTIEQYYEKLEFLTVQNRDIFRGDKAGQGIWGIKVSCECGKKFSIMRMYKCLYCEQYLCKSCAEVHLGMTVEEYRRKNPLPEIK